MEDSGYWVYILRCEGGRLYTGYTTDIITRFGRHMDGTSGSKFTRSFRPKGLAQCWRIFGTEGDAKRVEAAIKKLDRASKDGLVAEPETLGGFIREALGTDVEIRTFDPQLVEAELLRSRNDKREKSDPLPRQGGKDRKK